MSSEATGDVPKVLIPETESRQLESQLTGRTYDISVALPAGHGPDSQQAYPTIYVLDGQWDFKLVTSLYGGLHYDMYLPDAIVVGIEAGGDNPDHDALRAQDYTPTPRPEFEGSGQADRFLGFLADQLMPFIEEEYPAAAGGRTLLGSSMGGLFALKTLFERPDLFDRVVAVSPAIVWDEGTVMDLEARLAETRDDLAVRLFVAVGELEPAQAFHEPVERLVEQLRRRRYRGLELEHVVIGGERHAGVKPEAFNRGLRWVFTRPRLDLTEDALEEFEGEFVQTDDAGDLRIVLCVESDRLLVEAEPDSHDADELIPVASDEFVFAGRIPGEAIFHRQKSGAVDRLSIRLIDATIELHRVR